MPDLADDLTICRLHMRQKDQIGRVQDLDGAGDEHLLLLPQLVCVWLVLLLFVQFRSYGCQGRAKNGLLRFAQVLLLLHLHNQLRANHVLVKDGEIFLVHLVRDFHVAGQCDLLPILIEDERLDQVNAFLDEDPLSIIPFLDGQLTLEGLLADSLFIEPPFVNPGHICELQIDSERLDDVDRGRGHVGRELLVGHRDCRQSASQIRLEEAKAVNRATTSRGGSEGPAVRFGADAARYVLVEDAVILLLLNVAELVIEAGSRKNADGRERCWTFEEVVGGNDHERIDDCESHVGLIDVLVASCQDSHGHVGPAHVHRFDQEVVAFISSSFIDVGVAVSLGVE